MILQGDNYNVPLIGLTPRVMQAWYACGMIEFVELWRRTFGKRLMTVCSTEFRSGGNIYEGVENTSMSSTPTEWNISFQQHGVQCTDGMFRTITTSLNLRKVQWFQIGDNVYFLDTMGKHNRGQFCKVGLPTDRNRHQP